MISRKLAESKLKFKTTKSKSLYIHLTPRLHQQEIQKHLAASLPTCRLKILGLHPTNVVVRHDASQVIVSQDENGLGV